MILITQSLKELQQVMSDYVGIVRNNVRLDRASERIDLLFEETEGLYQTTTVSHQLLELRNMITVGYLIIKGCCFPQRKPRPAFQYRLPGKVRPGAEHCFVILMFPDIRGKPRNLSLGTVCTMLFMDYCICSPCCR
jgi:hypothetical protein